MDNYALNLAIDEAWRYQFLTYPNPAVGASLIVNNELFVNAHKQAGMPHAEVNVLWDAFSYFFDVPDLTSSHDIHQYLIKHHNNFFHSATLYVTLEPCTHIGKTPSCADLLSILKPKKVVIGYRDFKHTGGYERLQQAGIEVVLLQDQRCYDLIEPFVKWQDRFVFFKFAFSLNGVYQGGYISTQKTLEWVHQIRDKIDLLTIGGNTVRVDRPTLDARYIQGSAPDVMIYSTKKEFDKKIPLFDIEREVFVSDELDFRDYKFVMIEGGVRLYEQIKDVVDWKVFLVNSSFHKHTNFQTTDTLQILHTLPIDKDLIIFSR
ncbi:MAG: bifunctional diaminohydroxyphosphoribosylaminopyrimidine deaminase/5-amino-6-(5-phosphoribosylamino)uracil reductase RibD [Epsilonproteobacteria bacterium]|nr:bifunctional diaminohydroxyphosphoribosylaminopyrimidine deaminase/5-amino-6-(5-phosphoribosylamino)uracil reductase RibD [Campylobacterota bacterium]